MAATRRRFGPLIYGATTGAFLIAASQPYWGAVVEQWHAWGYARQLHDPTPGLREQAQLGLMQLGPAAGWWVRRALGDPDPRIRVSAVLALPATNVDRPPEMLDALIIGLRDGDPVVRRVAAAQMAGVKGWFSQVPPGAIERAVVALHARLSDADPLVQDKAVAALAQFGPPARTAGADLIRVMRTHIDPTVRVDAAETLLRIESVGSPGRAAAVASIREMLADPALGSVLYRLDWLLRPELGAAALAADLIPLLDGPNRRGAFYLLNGFPPNTPGVGVALDGLLRHADPVLRREGAFAALERHSATIPAALGVLADQLVHPPAEGGAPAEIVTRIRTDAPTQVEPIVARLIADLDRADLTGSRSQVAAVLGWIGPPEALPAVPQLRTMATAADPLVALGAMGALARIDRPSAVGFLPELLAWSQPDRPVDARLVALASLGGLGDRAGTAIPALLRIRDEPDRRISAAATAAIDQIDPARGGTEQAILGDR